MSLNYYVLNFSAVAGGAIMCGLSIVNFILGIQLILKALNG